MSREVGRIKKQKHGGKRKKGKKRERKALSEAINSSKKINKNYISTLLSFSSNKNKNTIKYKLSRYCEGARGQRKPWFCVLLPTERGSVQRNEQLKKIPH